MVLLYYTATTTLPLLLQEEAVRELFYQLQLPDPTRVMCRYKPGQTYAMAFVGDAFEY